MIEISKGLDALEKKYKLNLPEAFKAEVLGLAARHHLEMISLHQEMMSNPAMWRSSESTKFVESVALDMIKTQSALARAEGDKKSRWYDKLVLRRNGRDSA